MEVTTFEWVELNNLRELFKKFRANMKQSNVNCMLRVMIEPYLSKQHHDRWLLSRNAKYNLPSTDAAARGQYSEIKDTENSIPFEKYWESSHDIIDDCHIIDKRLQEYQNREEMVKADKNKSNEKILLYLQSFHMVIR